MEKRLFENITRYLDQEISEEARETFEAQMTSDISLRQAVAEVVAMRLALGEAIEEGLHTETRIVSMKKQNWLYLGAAAVVILIGLFLGLPTTKKLEPLALYEKYYAPPILPNFRDEESNDTWAKACLAYDQQKFEEAVPLLKSVLEDSLFAFRVTAHLAFGIAQIEIGALEPALSSLDNVPNTSALGQEAQWYRALVLLRLGQIEDARKALEKITTDPAHYRKDKAEELLQQLES